MENLHNPGQNDHQLRRMPITDYGANRSQIADDADHPQRLVVRQGRTLDKLK